MPEPTPVEWELAKGLCERLGAGSSHGEHCGGCAPIVRMLTELRQPQGDVVLIGYTNWKGVFRRRQIRPIRMYWGSTPWHPESQYLLEAHDLEKDAIRSFAMQDISFWRPLETP